MRLDPLEADARANLFGGQGTVRVWDLLRGGTAEPFAAVLACELEPGGSVGTHVQQEHPEIVVCLDGDGVATVEGVEHALVPGAVVHLPFGQRLAIANRSQAAPLAYLIIKAIRGT
jgi:quercetin dioxygenase-like cupin family protein